MRKYLWILAALTFVLGSCRHWGKRVRGNGHMKTEDRTVSSFKNVEVSGSTDVYVSQGDEHSIKIEGDENLLPYIEVSQEGDRVIIRNKPGYDLHSTGDMRIYVTAPVFNKLESSGAGNIIGQNKITNPEDMEIDLSGAGNIKMELDAPRVKADISGAGSVHLTGQTKNVEITLSGAGSTHCYDLLAETANVTVSGVGSAEIYASVKLDAEVNGVGSIDYKGNPGSVNQHVSGIGSINKVQ
jgi:hypothetical protein